MKEVLEQILKELAQAKKDSLGTYRSGDYRIGLTKAETIVNDKLLLGVVVRQSEQFVCGDCDKYIDCKNILEKDAPACKIYRSTN